MWDDFSFGIALLECLADLPSLPCFVCASIVNCKLMSGRKRAERFRSARKTLHSFFFLLTVVFFSLTLLESVFGLLLKRYQGLLDLCSQNVKVHLELSRLSLFSFDSFHFLVFIQILYLQCHCLYIQIISTLILVVSNTINSVTV